MRADSFFTNGTLLGFLYAVTRISTVVAFVPLAAFRAAPEPARIVLSLALTIMLRSFWPTPERPDLQMGHLIPALAGEAAVGVAVGLSLAVVLEVFQIAAHTVSLQAGLAYASSIDPTSGADSTVLLTLSQLTASLFFFVSGADRLFIRILAESLSILPPASFAPNRESGLAMIRFSAVIFSLGLRLAAPVITLTLLADASLAVLGRMQPHLHLVSLTMPVKLAVTMLLMALAVRLHPSFFESLMNGWVHFADKLQGMPR